MKLTTGALPLLLLCGCERTLGAGPAATMANAQAAGIAPVTESPRPPTPFVEGETCTRSADCPASARCFDGRCALAARSLRGEVLAERGARFLALSRFEEAGRAYTEAQRAYSDAQLTVPSAVSCGLARALTAQLDRGAAGEIREGAARASATCLANAPRASATGDQATAALVSLAERGLDMAGLDRDGGALMTGQDRGPTTTSTTVTIEFSGNVEGSRGVFKALVDDANVRREVTRCYLQWWEGTHQDSDQGSLRVTYSRAVDEYDTLTAARLNLSAPDLDPSIASADAGANTHWLLCSAGAIRTLATALRWPSRAERWGENVQIRVSLRANTP